MGGPGFSKHFVTGSLVPKPYPHFRKSAQRSILIYTHLVFFLQDTMAEEIKAFAEHLKPYPFPTQNVMRSFVNIHQ